MENLPSELLAHIAKFRGTRNYQEFEGSGWGTNSWKLKELLYLRCASKACAEGVRLAITDHEECTQLNFRVSRTGRYPYVDKPRGIAAVGSVFGAGCRNLDYSGDSSDERAPA